MTGRILTGPWRPRPARPEGRPFVELQPAEQVRLLRFALKDARAYWTDLEPGERWWLLRELPPVRPLRPESLAPSERARVADVLCLLLRRRAGWAA